MKSTLLVVLLALFLSAGGAWAQNADHKIDRGLLTAFTEDSDAVAPFFVIFKERADLGAASRIPDRAARGRAVVQALQATANRSQAGVRGYLQGRRVPFTSFWIQSAIYVHRGDLGLARALAQRPEVAAVISEPVYSVQPIVNTTPSPQAVGSNIAKIRADLVWPTTKGNGIRVANF